MIIHHYTTFWWDGYIHKSSELLVFNIPGDPWPEFSEAAVGLALSDPSQRSLLQARRSLAPPPRLKMSCQITRRRSNQEHKNLVGGANPSWRGKKR